MGATWTRVAVEEGGRIRARLRLRTPASGGRLAVAEKIAEAVEGLLGGKRPAAIGVASIGPLDLKRGAVVNTPNLPIGTFEIAAPLRERFGCPVYVINDAVAGAMAERAVGAGRGRDNVVYVTISTGVGGGAVVDGRVLIGKSGNAHEIGHIVVKYDSKVRCGCGGYGHWEAYAGGANLPRLARVVAESAGASEAARSGIYERALSGALQPPEIFEAARAGDPIGVAVVREVVEASAAGLASVINAYDPEVVSIGGGVFLGNVDLLYEPIRAGARRHLVTGEPAIVPTPLGDEAPLMGALLLAREPPPELLRLLGGH